MNTVDNIMNNNPKYRQEWILDSLKENSTIGFSELFSKYIVKFSKSEITFSKDWKKANVVFFDYHTAINNAKLQQSINSEKQAVKRGLKTKFDRLMILQNQVDVCLEQLSSRQCDDVYFIEGAPLEYKRSMKQSELNDTRKTLNILQVEISKIEGDYAVVKTEVEITKIQPVIFTCE